MSEAREATTLLPTKRRPCKKSIQNEKAENYDPDKGMSKKLRKTAKIWRLATSMKKTLD